MKKSILIMLLSAAILSPVFCQAAPVLPFIDSGINQPKLGARGTPAGTYAIAASTYVDVRVLAASTAETVTVPTGAKCVVFSGNADFYVNWITTATVPGADITDGSGSELNPGGRVIPVTMASFSIISPTATIVTMSWYK